jgi:hypothetical protein
MAKLNINLISVTGIDSFSGKLASMSEKNRTFAARTPRFSKNKADSD